uniref:DNA-directed RNA polymerase subunit n=1 Tax=Megaviridae environmental sample TaxID=1737588 RepID=A0A5J6VH24_9VIRU|nr:MAG: RNA polymerase Rpb1, domain 5 [Megaviridae environmental sample]
MVPSYGNSLPIKLVQFDILGNDQVKKCSVIDGEQGIMHSETYENNEPKPYGLLDSRLGVTDPEKECSTCRQDYHMCPGHWGHHKFERTIYHFGFLDYVKKILACVCHSTCKPLITADDPILKHLSPRNMNRFKEFKKLCTFVKVSPYTSTPVPKITQQIKNGSIQLVAEIITSSDTEDQDNMEVMADGKKKIKRIITATDAFNILNNISRDDCMRMGITDPGRMLLNVMPVPPIAIRPSNRGNFLAGGAREDSLTHKLADIIKYTNKLRKDISKPTKFTEVFFGLTQWNHATYYDNESSMLPHSNLKSGGMPSKSVTSRFKGGKQGRIRGNLQGKRVNYSGRTVITSDPNNALDEIGVPVQIAMIVTIAEDVTPNNIHELTRLVRNGCDVYPGAKQVIKFPLNNPNRARVINLKFKKDIELEYGWIVHRHLRDGDIVLLNRQPSLHKMSMMGHKVKVINDTRLKTLRLNVSATSPYNADFDGDEMNIFVPQSEQAQIELHALANVKNHIISPANSSPIISLVQDSLVGGYRLTLPDVSVDWKDAMNLLSNTTVANDLMYGNTEIKKNITLTGQELFSYLIKERIHMKGKNKIGLPFNVVNGKIDDNCILTKNELGAKRNNLAHKIFNAYGPVATRDFLDDSQRMLNMWLMSYNGSSLGLEDTILPMKTRQYIVDVLKSKTEYVNQLVTKMENNNFLFDEAIFEDIIYSELDKASMELAKHVVITSNNTNNMYVQISSGAKGTDGNFGQMTACVGSQSMGHEGSARIKKALNSRTMVGYCKNDDSAPARGFIASSYIEGLRGDEFFFHNMAGRIGLIDTAIKTAESGYLQRKLVKGAEDVKITYDSLVRNSLEGIVSIVYGDTGFDSTRLIDVHLNIIKMSNKELQDEFVFTASECKKHKISKQLNETIKTKMFKYRDNLRTYQQRSLLQYDVMDTNYTIPFDITRVIGYHKTKQSNTKNKKALKNSKEQLTAEFIWMTLGDLISPIETTLMALSHTQQEDTTSVKYRDQHLHKMIFKCTLVEYLGPKPILFKHKLLKSQFLDIIQEIKESFNKAVIQPGEMVGVLAAQSIGEPSTQMTLNTFHQAGKRTTGMMGIPRIKEIVHFSKKIKTPFTTIYLDESVRYDRAKVLDIAASLNYTTIRQVAQNVEIYYSQDVTSPDSPHQKDGMSMNVNEYMYVGLDKKKTDLMYMPLLIRIELDPAQMVDCNISTLDVKRQFVNNWNKKFSDKKALKKKERDLDKMVQYVCVLSNNDNSNQPCVHIRFDMVDYNQEVFVEFMELILDTFKLKGLDSLGKVEEVQQDNLITVAKDGSLEMKKEYVIMVNGSDLQSMHSIPHIDIKRTNTNDLFSIYKTFGVEAVRSAIIKEILKTFNGTSYIRHVSLLADVMTQLGIIMPVNRYGLTKLDTDPLCRASFEMTIEQLTQAAVFNETDYMNTVSGRVMTGRVINGGTGMPDIVMDYKKLINTQVINDKHTMGLKRENNTKFMPNAIIDDLF